MGNNKSRSHPEKGAETVAGPAQQPPADVVPNITDRKWTVDDDRYAVCTILAEKGIASVVWFEDLLALHGSNTQVWDVNLLVRDPRAAADALLDAGYQETPPDTKFEDEPEFSMRSVRMACFPSTTAVVLLPAPDWHYDMDKVVSNFLPPLSRFLDSMIEFWLNISSRDYTERLGFALYIGCLINYCYYLQDVDGEAVKDPAYAVHLALEHREVHYDIVATYPQKESLLTTRRHQYHARRSRESREGLFTPKPYQKGGFQTTLTTLSEQG